MGGYQVHGLRRSQAKNGFLKALRPTHPRGEKKHIKILGGGRTLKSERFS